MVSYIFDPMKPRPLKLYYQRAFRLGFSEEKVVQFTLVNAHKFIRAYH